MEKKQQTIEEKQTLQNGAPGQQLPTDSTKQDQPQTAATGSEQHSESSLPQSDNETLGTP